jgi:hypothetical protein
MSTYKEIEGQELELIQDYIENGRTGEMPEELVTYLNQLELIRGLHIKNKSRQFVINLLTAPPYSLSQYIARRRYEDCMNFFYLDTHIKKQAWRNIYAEKLEMAAKAVLATWKTPKDMDVYNKLIVSAAKMRGLEEPDKEELPEEVYKKPFKLYSNDPKMFVDMPNVSRKALAELIDSYDISEIDKDRLKEEASVVTPKLRLNEQLHPKD